jgi:hypothetical protein
MNSITIKFSKHIKDLVLRELCVAHIKNQICTFFPINDQNKTLSEINSKTYLSPKWRLEIGGIPSLLMSSYPHMMETSTKDHVWILIFLKYYHKNFIQ